MRKLTLYSNNTLGGFGARVSSFWSCSESDEEIQCVTTVLIFSFFGFDVFFFFPSSSSGKKGALSTEPIFEIYKI